MSSIFTSEDSHLIITETWFGLYFKIFFIIQTKKKISKLVTSLHIFNYQWG